MTSTLSTVDVGGTFMLDWVTVVKDYATALCKSGNPMLCFKIELTALG